jgi:hypothetical protein
VDEGIWSGFNINNGAGMQAVILSDGSYWGLYGSVSQAGGTDFVPSGVLQGNASINGSNASGAYTDFFETGTSLFQGTYSGTVSAQKNINLTFNDPSSPSALIGPSASSKNFNMSYDSIYNQPASISAIAGSYMGRDCAITVNESTGVLCGVFIGGIDVAGVIKTTYAEQVIISGSNLTVSMTEVAPNPGADSLVRMNGTLTPHGTAVNVFDVSLTTAAGYASIYVPAGTVFNGILFQTSSGNTEIIATSGNSAYYYIGSKQN